MIKTIYFCDACGKQKTSKGSWPPEGWVREYQGGPKDYCSKKCRPRPSRRKYVSANYDSDPGVGALYGRT